MGLQINLEPHWHEPVADPNGMMTLQWVTKGETPQDPK